MKAVLMSIYPQWREKIFDREKTIEVRKSRPSIPTPFKVYVYCTKGTFDITDCHDLSKDGVKKVAEGRGKVIGSFVCDRITCCQAYYGESGEKHLTNLFGDEVKRTCLTKHEMFDYIIGKGKKEGTGWLWHITEPKLFDKPRELGEFYRSLPEKVLENGEYDCRKEWDVLCIDAPEGGDYCAECPYGGRVQITRAPQSWVYCETIDER